MNDVKCREEMKTSKNIPGILLVTLPKSGTVYIWEALSKGLRIPKLAEVRIYGGWFPMKLVIDDRVKSLVQEGGITQGHIDASWQNKLVFSRYLDKMIVHVRDPRSSALEWAYHLLTLREQGQFEALAYQPRYCPDNFFSMSLTEQIEVQVQNFLPDAIKWIEGWVDAIEDSSFKTKVHLVQYEKFVEDEVAYFDSILEFYEIDKSLWNFTPFTPRKADNPLHEGELHFLNARTDQWRDDFTSEQLDMAGEMMPERLFKRFGWPRR